MRAPKGFAKNYFTLAAIQAYASHTLCAQCSARTADYIINMDDECDEPAEAEALDELLLCAQPAVAAHAGHGNGYDHRSNHLQFIDNLQSRPFIAIHRFGNSPGSPPLFTSLSPKKHLLEKGKKH